MANSPNIFHNNQLLEPFFRRYLRVIGIIRFIFFFYAIVTLFGIFLYLCKKDEMVCPFSLDNIACTLFWRCGSSYFDIMGNIYSCPRDSLSFQKRLV